LAKADVLLGLQWGDEGKGKIVDYLSRNYSAVARFQGGPNAGHSLVFEGERQVLNTVPSGIFHDNCHSVIGNGVVIDPVLLKRELDTLTAKGVPVHDRLVISNRAHLILPTHRLLDAALERAKGEKKIGSTLKGIGPAYQDKAGRLGVRVGDMMGQHFDEKLQLSMNHHRKVLRELHAPEHDETHEKAWKQSIDYLKTFTITETENFLHNLLENDHQILSEGAQGTMLDLDFGSYPYVTSSNTTTGGACTGLGISPRQIGEVYGVFKAYCTRVGSGPFPTELLNEEGNKLRDLGHEFGSTTGRPRRCGWLDLVALKHAIRLTGTTKLVMTKADILSEFDDLFVCTSYVQGNDRIDYVPFELNSVLPHYEKLSGWQVPLTGITQFNNLPKELKEYIKYIERFTSVPITMVSTGPDRKQTIFRG